MTYARFDQYGDLWIPVGGMGDQIPKGVETTGFYETAPPYPGAMMGSYGVAVTHMNLTKYIKSLTEKPFYA